MKITLCGSARFEDFFHKWNKALSLCGHTVFSLACFPSIEGTKTWYTAEEKSILDAVHRDKIAASDAILVLNRHAYLGESTLREIEYARQLDKKLYALESWGQGKGVGYMHNEAHRRDAVELGVWLKTSPIDTFYPHFKYPYDLLGDAGAKRSALVEMLKEKL